VVGKSISSVEIRRGPATACKESCSRLTISSASPVLSASTTVGLKSAMVCVVEKTSVSSSLAEAESMKIALNLSVKELKTLACNERGVIQAILIATLMAVCDVP
jgi:hypothetical protein